MSFNTLLVETACGWVQGVQEDHVAAFYGLRYAEKPLRFHPPQPLKPWSGVVMADSYGPAAPQSAPLDFNPKQSEDCLTLNIWTNGLDHPSRPVVLFIHGGAFSGGSGTNPAWHGGAFADQGIVFITVNYRLGVLGFMDFYEHLGEEYRSSGNNGLLDLIEALRWIRTNIAQFGGDPNRVTVMGQSAGAKCVGGLLSSPLADDLFHQAILMSGSVQSIRDQTTSGILTREFLAELGLEPAEAHKIVEMPIEELMRVQQEWGQGLAGLHLFGPVIDGSVIPVDALQNLTQRSKPLPAMIIGTNRQECNTYIADTSILNKPTRPVLIKLFGDNAEVVAAAYERRADRKMEEETNQAVWSSILTDYLYQISTVRTAEAYSKAGADVWVYRFDQGGPSGAIHGIELPYVWYKNYPPYGAALADRVHNAWIEFIKNGTPISEFPEWNRFDEEQRSIMLLDHECSVGVVNDDTGDSGFQIQVLVKSAGKSQ